MNKFSEKDWKLFRKKISGWQEAYMEKLNREYIALLNEEGECIGQVLETGKKDKRGQEKLRCSV